MGRARRVAEKAEVVEPKDSAPKACVPGLSPEHQEKCEKIRGLLDGHRDARAKAWYAVGQEVAEIMGPLESGKKAVAKIAEAIGRDSSLLYEAGRVAQTWLRQEFEELLERRDEVRGNRLSWSHFVELERVADAQRRGLLIERTLKEGLSVRDLKREINGHGSKQDEDDDRATNVEKALRNLKATCETIVENSPRWDKLIFGVLEKRAKKFAAPGMPALLGDVREAQLRARQVCDEQLAKLDACITRAKELLAGADTGQALGRPSARGNSKEEDNG